MVGGLKLNLIPKLSKILFHPVSIKQGVGDIPKSLTYLSKRHDSQYVPKNVKDASKDDLTNEKYDAVIIGSGHNGLTCANFLGKNGKKTLILEKRDIIGGATVTEELVPGYKFSRFSYVLALLRKTVIDGIFPSNWKDQVVLYKRNPSSFTPTKELEKYLLLGSDRDFNREQISKFSIKDAENFEPYEDKLSEVAQLMTPFLDDEPVLSFKSVRKAFMRNMNSKTSVSEMYQIMTAPASTILNQYFESDILKATLASDAVIGTNQSPFSPNTSYVLVHHIMGEIFDNGVWAFVQGGMGTLSNYMAHLAEQRGSTIAVNAFADEIVIDPITNKIAGVKLSNGQVINSSTVITNCTNHVTYDSLLRNSNELLPEDFKRGINNVNYQGVQVKFNLILNDMPRFKCLEHLWNDDDTFLEKIEKYKHYLQGTIHINMESMDDIHNAYVDCFNGRYSKRPMVELIIPSILDPTLTPSGEEKLVAAMFVQYAPYKLSNGTWNKANRDQFIQNTFDVVDEYAPNFSSIVEFNDAIFPPDLEDIINMTGGNIFHGALDLNNMFLSRPMPNYASYQWPIEGLWSCGSSNHPGGGVMGAPGRNCALKILEKGL